MESKYVEIGANTFSNNSLVWSDIYISGIPTASNGTAETKRYGGTYHYRESGQIESVVCRNRFIVWRSLEGYVELIELSWDTNLIGNAVRLHIPPGGGTILYGVKIYELTSNVVILLATSSVVYRLILPHPQTIAKDSRLIAAGKGLPPSIFMFAKNDGFDVVHIFDDTLSIIGTCSSSLCTIDGTSIFVIGSIQSSSLYFVTLPSFTTGGGLPDRFVVDQKSIISKLWNILPSTKTNIDESPVCLEMHCFDGEYIVISLCYNMTLKLWSTQQRKCVLEHNLQQYMCTEGIIGERLMLRKSTENNSENVKFVINFSSEICIFELILMNNQLVLNHIMSCFIPMELMTFDYSVGNKELNVKDISLTNDHIWIILIRKNSTQVYHCMYRTDGTLDKAVLLPMRSYDTTLLSLKDSRENYVDIIFTPGHFSMLAITKALMLYGYKFIGEQSIIKLKRAVIRNIEQEIRTAAGTTELTDGQYVELVYKCWNKFYNCCIQYEQLLRQPLGISCDIYTGMITVVYNGTLSYLVPLADNDTSTDNSILLKCIDLIHSKLSYQVLDAFVTELSYNGNYPVNIVKDMVNTLLSSKLFAEFSTEFKHLYGQFTDIVGTVNDIIQTLNLATLDNEYTDDNISNDMFLELLDIYSNTLSCKLLSAGVREFCLKRLKFCCDLLLFCELIDQLSLKYKRGLIDTQNLLQLIYNYHVLYWLATKQATPINKGVDVNLESLNISGSAQSNLHDCSLIELYLITMGRGYCSNVLSNYRSMITKQSINEHWIYLLPKLLYCIIRQLWPQTNSLIIHEFLLSKYQCSSMQAINRYIDRYVNDDKFSRQLLLGYSYLGLGLTHKSITCFINAFKGITSEKYLIRFCQSDNYWIKIMRLLEEVPLPEGVVEVMLFAVKHYPKDVLMWSNLFKYSLLLHQYDIAYNAIICNPDEQRRKECLRHFITVLTERKMLKLLCNYNFCGLEDEVVIVMEMNARNNDPVFTDCYNVLFAYHISRENYWKAAQIKYEEGYRISIEKLNYEGMNKQRYCYIVCWSLLMLVDSKYQWIIKPKSDKITLKELNRECHLLKSKLLLIKHNNSLAEQLCSNYVTVSEVCSLLIHCGLFDNAIQLCKVFETSCNDVIDEVTTRCITLSYNIYCIDDIEATPYWAWLEHNKSTVALFARHSSVIDQSWQMLRQYLLAADSEELIQLLVQVINKILTCNCHVPQWITDRLKMLDPAQLLRIYISYRRYDLAISLAIDYIDAVLGKNKEQFGLTDSLHIYCPSVWLPHNTFDQLLSLYGSQTLSIKIKQYMNELEKCSLN